jgi:hypothetical protein
VTSRECIVPKRYARGDREGIEGVPAPNDWIRTPSVGFQEGAVSATDDTLYFGFGLEGIRGADTRADVLGRSLQYLLH